MEPLGYESDDPRLVPTAAAFAEGVVETATGTGLRVVFGVEPGALGTATVDVNFENTSTVDYTAPISRAKELAMRSWSCSPVSSRYSRAGRLFGGRWR